MSRRRPGIIFLGACAIAGPALAGDLRPACFDRPGLGTPPCIVDQGHFAFEIGLLDWTRDDADGARTDTLTGGSMLLRYGVTRTLEVQLGWTAIGHVRERDTLAGTVIHATGTGDLNFALVKSLHNPDGSGFSVAAMPYVTAPVGSDPIGGSGWSAGLVLPMGVDLGGPGLSFTPRLEIVPNADGSGGHVGYGSVLGISFDLSKSLSLTEEVSLYRDDDPQGATTEALNGISMAWKGGTNSQWDIGTAIGLNHNSPDIEVAFGFARRF